ncbi:expressed protein [Chlorella variabilis]|uniref:Expressed protein n=1 Tax=Chlorella variabilis TaxID=554065 RepID=E1ZEQ7_CHLVA|nr:expressed protein [Chlorella variabilis]EFN55540.1 expressed protein [Chlorella variabilis]|eukprot:XP_005847642.1 expressed protein [Chlorella variabilis]
MACTLACTAALSAPSSTTRAPRTLAATAALPQRRRRQQRRLAVRAAAQPEPDSPASAVQDFARNAERVLSRYDFLSAGMGAMLVTGFCVARGQDLGTALWITAAATVVAILVNDVLPEER